MALKQLPKQTSGLIHHSDRGVQYCCGDYVKKLCKGKVAISMTEDGDPRENAIAERVNGILKEEWLNQIKPESAEQALNGQYIVPILRDKIPANIVVQDYQILSLSQKDKLFKIQ